MNKLSVVSVALVAFAIAIPRAQAQSFGIKPLDHRIRNLLYVPDQVVRVRGWVGYHIDLEFEPGESFVTLGGGDLQGLTYGAYDNHLVLKPKAASVRTNLTVFTTRRTYVVDYAVSARVPDLLTDELVYSLRFMYPTATAVTNAARVSDELKTAASQKTQNRNYWYCGVSDLRPIGAFDDGAHTHLQFSPQAEMPAIFIRAADGSESLLNYSIQDGEVVIHRLARRFVLRRGTLTGCIVNKGFVGSGERLDSGTLSPNVERQSKELAR